MNPYTIICAAGATSAFPYIQTADNSFLGGRANLWTLAVRGSFTRLDTINTALAGNSTPSSSPATGILSVGRNSATTLYSLTTPTEIPATVTNANLNLESSTRTGATPTTFGDTDMAALCIATAAISNAMRNRIMRHYGYSFKRAL
jgi:hypothetical protein